MHRPVEPMQRSDDVSIPVQSHQSGTICHEESHSLKVTNCMQKALAVNTWPHLVQDTEWHLSDGHHPRAEFTDQWDSGQQTGDRRILLIGGHNQWHPQTVFVGNQVIRQSRQSVNESIIRTGLGSLQIIPVEQSGHGFRNDHKVFIWTQSQTVGEVQTVQ